jgi:uncharacterized repeat protein (TIGR01451 family)
VTGISEVQASSSIPVDGQPGLTRTTGTQVNTDLGGSLNAKKLWIKTRVFNAANDTEITPTTVVVSPATVYDKLYTAPGLGGSVKFTLYKGACTTGSVVQADTVLVRALDGSFTSPTATLPSPTVDTSYCYVATFNQAGLPPSLFPTKAAADEPFKVTPAFVPLLPPDIEIAKCPAAVALPCIKSVGGVPKDFQEVIRGGTAHFRITVTNTGDVTLHDVTVTDRLSKLCDRSLGTMEKKTSKTFTCTQANVTAGYLNVAKVVGTSPKGVEKRDTDPSKVLVPAITIAKCPAAVALPCIKSVGGVPKDQQEVLQGGTANFRIKVTNTGNVALHDVMVTDQLSKGCVRSLGTMERKTSKTYTCTQADVTAGYLNVAKVVGTSAGGKKLTDTDPSKVLVPAIAIAKCPAAVALPCIKRPVGDPKDQQTDSGDQQTDTPWTAHFRITVTNTGDVPLHDVTVMDQLEKSDVGLPLALFNDCGRTYSGTMAPGGTPWTYTCTVTRPPLPVKPSQVKSKYPCGYLNRASVVGTSPAGQKLDDYDDSSVAHICYTG